MEVFDNAWALGRWDEDDLVLEAWKSAARGHGIEAREDIAQVLPELSERSLVLLRFGLDIATSTFAKLRDTRANLIVYVPPGSRKIEPKKAVQLCSEGVLGFFSARDDLPEVLRSCLKSLYSGRPMFRRIVLPFAVGEPQPKRAFLSSPFSPGGAEFLDAAEAALIGRGIRVGDAGRAQRGERITQKLEALIEEADFIVANMRITEKGHNPNVWMEIGMARGLGKPVVPFRYAGDAELLAKDQLEIEHLEYHDELDLAMKLYWGLDWKGGR
jgi:hypothetical protein